MSLLEMRNIKKSFDGTEVLKDISLTVEKGEVLGIIGPSGSGKSTLLRCATDLEKPDSGEIHYEGTFGLVFQNFNLFPHYSVMKNITDAPLRVQKRKKDEVYQEARELLAKMGLSDKEQAYPYQLSGGQQQRVALARMMIGEPEAILLDEPFSALDGYLKDVLQREMQDFLKDYSGDMILVTHSRDEAYKFCRELSIVHEGRILVTGETKQLFERPGLLEAAKLTGCKNFSRAERLGSHEIYAADWKMKLHTEENVDEDITYVGIRGHWIRPEAKPGENCMAVRVDQYIETTFEHQYMIRNKAEENAAGLWWMRPKNSFTEDPDKDLPEYLYLPPEHLMLLK